MTSTRNVTSFLYFLQLPHYNFLAVQQIKESIHIPSSPPLATIATRTKTNNRQTFCCHYINMLFALINCLLRLIHHTRIMYKQLHFKIMLKNMSKSINQFLRTSKKYHEALSFKPLTSPSSSTLRSLTCADPSIFSTLSSRSMKSRPAMSPSKYRDPFESTFPQHVTVLCCNH